MSRLSKAVRRIKIGPIVTILVKLAETLLGGGTGALKKKLVMEIIAIIKKRVEEAGQTVPENIEVVADELVEQTVTLMNEVGALGASTVDAPVVPEPTPIVPATPAKRRGRKPGSTNKGKAVAAPVAPVTRVVEEEDLDLSDFGIDEDEL